MNSISSQIALRHFLSETDGEFSTRAGDIGAVLVTTPKDVECSEQTAINEIAERMTRCWRLLDTRFRVYQYWIRIRTDAGLYTNSTLQVLLLTAGGWSDKPALFPESAEIKVTADLSYRRTILSQKIKSWMDACSDFLPMRMATKLEAFALFYRLFNPGCKRIPRLLSDIDIHRQIADTEWIFPKRSIQGVLAGATPEIDAGSRHVAVLSLRSMPQDAGEKGYPVTTPNMLEPLASFDGEFILCIQNQGVPEDRQRAAIKSAKRTHSVKEKGIAGNIQEKGTEGPERRLNQEAVFNVESLSAAQRQVAQGIRLNQFCMSVIVHAASSEERDRAAESVKSAMDISCRMVTEGLRRQDVVFGMCPGGYKTARCREKKISDANLSDFSILFGEDAGETVSQHLKMPAVRVLKTVKDGPYYWNWHRGDVGHLLITGKTGSGKTVLSKVLIRDSQKYLPYTSITDLAGTYEHLTAMCGGSYTRVELGSDHARMSPLAMPDSKEQRDFVTALVALLVEQRGRKLDADQIEDIHQSVVKLYESEEPKRLGSIMGFLPEDMRRPMRRWVEPGQYSWLLDNEESLANENEFQTHEFVGLDDEDHRELLEPLFMAKFHVDTMRMRDPRRIGQLKILAFDEAWVTAESPRGLDYLRGGLKRARMFNTVVMLATQSPKDASRSSLWPVINQCCDKIFLADPEMTAEEYAADFGLQPKQVETIKGLIPKRQLFVRNAGESGKVLALDLSPDELMAYATDAPTVKLRQEAIEKYGPTDWLAHLGNGHALGGNGASAGDNLRPVRI